ncbi:MAG TPA: Hsp20/alpha crystallin family protein [Candidatus Polarisedimenticolia bacterium]|nr:Hsp20/alpha crystallin family protein [Candidatus Polarisedimenticolia bacterium]
MASLGPFVEISRIQNEINRLFDNLLELRSSGGEVGGEWLPNADVYETDKELVVKFELPGVTLKDVTLAINGNSLVVRGEKKRSESARDAKFHCMERGFGKFKRVVHITSPVNTHAAATELVDGVLKVSFPRVPNRRGEEVPIPIKDGGR